MIKQLLIQLPSDTHQTLKLRVMRDGLTLRDWALAVIHDYLNGTLVSPSLLQQAERMEAILSQDPAQPQDIHVDA
jgi:hypothetical protein